ncbi:MULTISPECIES: hypothetical protein [Paraburkholderia]|uniref:hypothetical protein n=1 Tax=Paraburkholderia TaxID=1822464 RepID=UPI00225B4402|nr:MULTISPECIES: hypothetical protein [Paraburkholderia]MCX4154981.1 hypothetical protein [Paraburkholderia aspalathi]MDN7164391.1 hypothetical protein [Paraburkholderia sp. SECH2]MDQ6392876.1 hypothetical protein [Paraburkholderia aspalathi]
MIEELQSFTSKGVRKNRKGPRKLNANEINEVWEQVQAKHRAGLGWKVPEPIAQALALK